MSHKTFHDHGADEIRITILQRSQDIEDVAKANPQKRGESDGDYDKRIEELHAATAKRVDLHIFEAENFLAGPIQQIVEASKDGDRHELIFRDHKVIKTLNQVSRENPQGKDEKEDAYKERIQKLYDEQG